MNKQEILEENIAQKIRFQMDIIAMDFENQIEPSMKNFYKVLENLLFEVEKKQQKRSYSEEDIALAFNEGQAYSVRGKLVDGKEWLKAHKKEWFNKFKKK